MRAVWTILGLVLFCVAIYSVLPNFWTRILHRALRKGPSGRQKVALTFDDGPDPQYTPRLLDALKQAHARATFFVLADKARAHPDIIRRMVSEGHDVEVHGYTHAMVPLLLPRQTVRQFEDSRLLLRREFGIEPLYYRPTWGLCNLWTLCRLRGMRLVTWSIMVGDWRKVAVHTLLARIIKSLHPGAIIVLHDSDATPGAEAGAPESVIQVIGPLVSELQDRGYTVGTLHSLMATVRAGRQE